jgi:hypothetical protein
VIEDDPELLLGHQTLVHTLRVDHHQSPKLQIHLRNNLLILCDLIHKAQIARSDLISDHSMLVNAKLTFQHWNQPLLQQEMVRIFLLGEKVLEWLREGFMLILQVVAEFLDYLEETFIDFGVIVRF